MTKLKDLLDVKNLYYSYYDNATDTQELEFNLPSGHIVFIKNITLDEEDRESEDVFDEEKSLRKYIDRAELSDIEFDGEIELQDLLDIFGMSIKKLSEITESSYSQIHGFVSGDRDIRNATITTFEKIAKAFGLTTDYLSSILTHKRK